MINIISDFKDYYDSENDNNSSNVQYIRKRIHNNKCLSLRALKNMGIPVIDIEPVSKIVVQKSSDLLVVYDDIGKHNGEGKSIVDFNEANMLFSNKLCSLLSKDYDGYTYKYVQIGKRRFWVILKNENNKLKEKMVFSIKELSQAYIDNIRLPIYSIDYTYIQGVQTAVDFNTVQNLGKLGFQEVISSLEIKKEIYNRLERR